jgi:hypothetical protein
MAEGSNASATAPGVMYAGGSGQYGSPPPVRPASEFFNPEPQFDGRGIADLVPAHCWGKPVGSMCEACRAATIGMLQALTNSPATYPALAPAQGGSVAMNALWDVRNRYPTDDVLPDPQSLTDLLMNERAAGESHVCNQCGGRGHGHQAHRVYDDDVLDLPVMNFAPGSIGR